MKLVISGLSSQSEKTLGIFMERTMKRWSWTSAPAHSTSLPPADAYIIDLVAWGFGQWSEHVQSQLIALTVGCPAVLLSSTNERSWAKLDSRLATKLGLYSVFKPYRSEEMRDVLDRIAGQFPKADSWPQNRLAVAAPIAKEIDLQRAPEAQVQEQEAPGLTVQELHRQLNAMADMEQQGFLRKLTDMLQDRKPLEVRFTIQNLMIVNPEHGWVISNTPMQVLERVCKSKALASVVNMRHIEVKDAEVWALRLNVPIFEMEPFLLQLATAAFAEPQITSFPRP